MTLSLEQLSARMRQGEDVPLSDKIGRASCRERV